MNFREELNKVVISKKKSLKIQSEGEDFLQGFLMAFKVEPGFENIPCLSFLAEGDVLFARETGVSNDIFRAKYHGENAKEILAYIKTKLEREGFEFGPEQDESYFEIFV